MKMRIMITAVACVLLAPVAALAASPEQSMTPVPAATAQPAAAQSAAEPAPQTAAGNPVGDKVAADWAKYDGGNKGHLNRVEFGKWMTELRASASQPAPDSAWLKSAFVQTDTDKDAKVTAAELTTFLSAGA
jgi:hypothetical protein